MSEAMNGFVGEVLQVVAIACLFLGCVTLHRRVRNLWSFLFLASLSALLFVSTIGVWALGWYNGQPYADDWLHAVALAFAESLLELQFALVVAASVSFLLASLGIRKPGPSNDPTPSARVDQG